MPQVSKTMVITHHCSTQNHFLLPFALAGWFCLSSRSPAIRPFCYVDLIVQQHSAVALCAVLDWPISCLNFPSFLFSVPLTWRNHRVSAAVSQQCRAQHQPNRGICSHSWSYPRLPTLYSETQHFSSSVIHMSDFPLQNKTTSDTVLKLSWHLQKKTCSLVQLPSFPAELFLQPLFQLLSEHFPAVWRSKRVALAWQLVLCFFSFFWACTRLECSSTGVSVFVCSIVQISLGQGPHKPQKRF